MTPVADSNNLFTALGQFLSKKSKVRRTTMLTEYENYVTDIKDLCEIFVNWFSTNAISIGCLNEIDVTKPDFVA